MASAPSKIVDFEAAVRLVLDQARTAVERNPPGQEAVDLPAALNRVLAESIRADRDQPGFDRATRDGFAIRSGDWIPGTTLAVVGQVRAGELWRGPSLEPGQALEIMTGASMPDGADAVVMVEHVLRTPGSIAPADTRLLQPAENVVPRGREARLGAEVLPAGTRIGAAEIALAATCGCARVTVTQPPAVAIVATGDELVELDQVPEPQQIRNSNSYSIAAMVTAAGGQAQRLPTARDLRDSVRERIASGRNAAMLVLSGGVSMGEYDLVEEVLTECGAEFFFTGVRMQPGRPVVFGRLPPAHQGARECFFFGLPGNPISTQVTFHCFAELFLRTLAGEPVESPRFVQATLAEPVAPRPDLTRLLPARLQGIHVTTVGWQGSGDLAANARANCYAEFKPEQAYVAGDVIRILLR